jgi:hypothetical protein
VRLGQYATTHTLIQRSGDDRGEQLSRGDVGQSANRQVGQPGQLLELAGLALCEQEDNRLGRQPPSHEGEHLRRGSVKPLDVIDQADQWTLFRRVR